MSRSSRRVQSAGGYRKCQHGGRTFPCPPLFLRQLGLSGKWSAVLRAPQALRVRPGGIRAQGVVTESVHTRAALFWFLRQPGLRQGGLLGCGWEWDAPEDARAGFILTDSPNDSHSHLRTRARLGHSTLLRVWWLQAQEGGLGGEPRTSAGSAQLPVETGLGRAEDTAAARRRHSPGRPERAAVQTGSPAGSGCGLKVPPASGGGGVISTVARLRARSSRMPAPGLQEGIDPILLGSLWPQSLFEKAQQRAPALMVSLSLIQVSLHMRENGWKEPSSFLLPHTHRNLSNLSQKSVINSAQRGPASFQICTENRAAYRSDQHLMLSSLLGLLQ